MARIFNRIDDELKAWISQQKVFFTATAPLGPAGHINCSPKGMDTFRLTEQGMAGYLDLHGSGAETIAHLRENGRLVIMFCAFEGPPRIVRLHGRGQVLPPGTPGFKTLLPQFPQLPGVRSIIQLKIERISDSCGYAVPRMKFLGDRNTLLKWSEKKGEDGLKHYREKKNRTSLDGLPGCDY